MWPFRKKEVAACEVHILDAHAGRPRRDVWVIGERIPRETYDRLKDESGALFVLIYYEGGQPVATAVTKAIWDQAATAVRNA